MIKYFAALIACFVVLPLSAVTPEVISHYVLKDKLVKKGTIKITTKDRLEASVQVEIKYKILAKVLFFERVVEGTKTILLPEQYLSEYGYEDLEARGRISDKNITAIHIGRINLPHHYDCHRVRIIPRGDRKWDGIFTYCPDIPSVGFARTKITMHEIPYVGTHTVYSRIIE